MDLTSTFSAFAKLGYLSRLGKGLTQTNVKAATHCDNVEFEWIVMIVFVGLMMAIALYLLFY